MYKPNEVKKVYDNGGKTIDRYSIYAEFSKDEKYLFCSSENPSSPMGVWSMAEKHQFQLGRHLGKLIEWDSLPQNVKNAVIYYLDTPVITVKG